MRPGRRWIAVGLGVVLALAVAGYAGASYYGYDLLTAATPHCDGRFPDDTPASFGTEGISGDFTAGGFDTTPYAMPGYREVSFPSRDARQPNAVLPDTDPLLLRVAVIESHPRQGSRRHLPASHPDASGGIARTPGHGLPR